MDGEQLRQGDEAIAQNLDQHLSANFLGPCGGLRLAVSAGGAQREALITQLHGCARHAVLSRLASIDIAGSALTGPAPAGENAGETEEHPIRRCLAIAKPTLPPSGGNRRLYCIVPAEAAPSLSPEQLATQIGPEQFQAQPAVVPDASGDVVLLYETGELSVKHAAAALIDARVDLADVATRLHTRSDVTWTQLVG
jgi:hypothetical protein